VDAPKSVGTKKGTKVRLEGGSYITEGPDDDDSFPPAIARYEVKEGWLFYYGKNGSEGVIVGSQPELDAWAAQVDKLRGAPGGKESTSEEWTPAHGGTRNVELAKKAVAKAARLFKVGNVKIEVLVNPDAIQTGDHVAGKVTIFNPQKDQGQVKGHGKLSGISVPAFAHVGAHEVAHLLFTHKSSQGHAAAAKLKEFSAQHGTVTLYHTMEGPFEGLMDLASFYVNVGPKLKATSPELYAIIEDWVK
jgi:hypothetical protein